jgi:homoserine acetyltransferase
MTFSIRQKSTEEEKIAIKLGNILSDLRIDIEQVGRYLGRTSPNVVYNRLITVAESAQYEKEGNNDPRY